MGVVLYYLNLSQSQPLKKYAVSIAVSKTPLSAPFYVAQAINAFDHTCVSVSYVDVIGGQRAFAKVMSDETEFGTSSDSVIAFQSLAKYSFVTHAMFVQSDNDVKLMTRSSENINTLIDLKGKKVGVTKDTASDYFLSNLLAIEGLTIKDVELHDYIPEQLIHAFNRNEVDAIVPWEPYAFNALTSLKGQIKVHDTKNLNSLSFNLISKRADDLLVKKATCILHGLNTAIEYMALNPEKAKKIVMKELNVASSFIDWVWPDYIFKLELNESLILNIESQAEWAIDTHMNEFSDMPNVSDFVDARAMLEVNPEAVNIQP